ncbi:transcriptional regulator SlyA [Agarivorans gilvus]|jgi:MarR family transcriptional regulator for hemolysin|uniref:MarR family transcriptional regulator n=1 Tax=Agarivorans gilvus TaxID=680279 RepID=A0ABQ1I7P8_9ALTE|nr:transcriptional regulator SlyA [Agarivorans gilvus]GGB20597.1 MarR family transcriptional regulator [Agarivorans gilvus]
MHDLDNFKALATAEQLGRVSRLWRRVADIELQPLGLTNSRWTVLWKLKNLNQAVTQKHLAEVLGIELASLMRTLNQLEEQELIIRRCCGGDRRAREVSFTEQGRSLVSNIEQRILSVRAEVLRGVSEQELQQMSSILEKIALNITHSIAQRTDVEGLK